MKHGTVVLNICLAWSPAFCAPPSPAHGYSPSLLPGVSRLVGTGRWPINPACETLASQILIIRQHQEFWIYVVNKIYLVIILLFQWLTGETVKICVSVILGMKFSEQMTWHRVLIHIPSIGPCWTALWHVRCRTCVTPHCLDHLFILRRLSLSVCLFHALAPSLMRDSGKLNLGAFVNLCSSPNSKSELP